MSADQLCIYQWRRKSWVSYLLCQLLICTLLRGIKVASHEHVVKHEKGQHVKKKQVTHDSKCKVKNPLTYHSSHAALFLELSIQYCGQSGDAQQHPLALPHASTHAVLQRFLTADSHNSQQQTQS